MTHDFKKDADEYTATWDEKINDPSLKPLKLSYLREKDEVQSHFLAGAARGLEVGKTEIENLKELLYHSEQWRQAYRRGKLELYAKGGEVADAAMSHLPCSEGPLERSAVKALGERTGWIELKHHDQLKQQLAEAESVLKFYIKCDDEPECLASLPRNESCGKAAKDYFSKRGVR